MKPHSKIWIYLFFLVSGATGLIYEVVWTRLLTLVMGNTQYSVATVLTAFMGGLALGSYLGGKIVDRPFHPLAVYAVLEALIGGYCLLIPHMIDWAFPLFKSIYLSSGNDYTQASFYRFFVCAGILLIPTSLMGATLPVLSKFVSKDPALIGRDVGTLYSINTFGAVFGAFASAFLLMRIFGVQTTIQIAAGCNLAIAALIFLWMKPPLRLPGSAQEAPALPVKFGEALILLCFGISGLSALVYQVAWNRILSLVLGSSIYAFSLILTTFILGLALGTVCFSRWMHVFKDRVKVFGALQIGIGIAALMVLPLFGKVPFMNRWVYENLDVNFSSIQGANFIIIFLLLFVPTFFMGGQFPIVIKLVAKDLSTLGRHVGRVYASNTVGTIIGSFLAGFIMVPWIGIQNTVLVAVYLNLGLGIGLLAFSPSLRPAVKAYGLPFLALVCLWQARSVDAWDRAVISSGSFMPYRIADLKEAEQRNTKVLFYREGTHTTVTTELAVTGNIFLRVNGKTDASLALDMRTQLLSGYIPMFFSEKPKSALVIGQGSGITLGAVEQFPVEEIDLVEISPAVIEGSRFFSPFNHNALEDAHNPGDKPRLNLVLADGRNHIALTEKKYDVIISEPSNPWISGIGALFTKNFFQLLKQRLNPKGVVCIWVHTNMSPTSFKSITKTFSVEFPFVTMWESIAGDDYLLIGSESPYQLAYEKVEHLLKDEARGRDLRQIGVSSVRDLMSLMIMSRDELLRFSGDAPIHTDDNSLLEFSAPKYIYRDDRETLVRQLTPFIKIDPGLVGFQDADPELSVRVLGDIVSAKRSESQIAEIEKKARVERLLEDANKTFNSGDASGALKLYQEVLRTDPENILTNLNMGNVLAALTRTEEAEQAFVKTLVINPYYIFGAEALAKLYLSAGRIQEAASLMESIHIWYSGDATTHQILGLAYALDKKPNRAIQEWRQSVRMNPEQEEAHYYLGVQLQKVEPGQAKEHLEKFLLLVSQKNPDDSRIGKAEDLVKKL